MKKAEIVPANRIADAIGIDRSTMSRLITGQKIKGVERHGRSWFFRFDDVMRALQAIPEIATAEPLPLLDDEPQESQVEAQPAPVEQEIITLRHKAVSAVGELKTAIEHLAAILLEGDQA